MSGLSEEDINKMVNELVQNKESVSAEEKTESTTSTEQKQDSNATNQDLNKLMSGLFSELITSFIPPEVKNNKNLKMNKMMKMLLSSFEQSKNKETDTSDENKSGNEENQPTEENANHSDEDQSEEEQPDEDVQSEEEPSQSEDEDESEDESDESDDEDANQSDTDQSEDDVESSIFVILQNGTAIGYTTSFSTAEKKSIQFYKQFIFKNTTRYLRTEKSLGQITVYERNPHLLLPFLENIVFELSIVSLSEL